MDFGEVLTKAWKIIWKFKVLWIFGILTSCGQGNGGNGGGANSGIRFSGNGENLPPGFQQFFYNLEYFFNQIQAWQIITIILGFFLLAIIISAIMAAINTVGRIGMIQGTVAAEEGAETLNFMELFNRGKPFFWRIFAFNLLATLAFVAIVLLLLIPFIGITAITFGIGLLCLLPFICILIPVGWLVNVILEQANIAIVVEDLNILDGLKRGWQVFQDNIGNVIVMALILGIGGGILGIILALPIFLLIAPVIIGVIAGSATGSDFLFGGGIAMALLCFATFLPILILLQGVLQAYIKTTWTLTYLRLTQGAPAQHLAVEELPDDTNMDEVLPSPD